MSHVDEKLDTMKDMLEKVVELQRFQLQQSQDHPQGALTQKDD